MDTWFDPRLGTTGGSDAEFFKRVAESGGTIVHERAGLVFEDIEPERCNWRAVLNRRFKAGVNYGKMTDRESTVGRWANATIRSGYGLAIALAGAPGLALGKPGRAFRGASRIAIALGIFMSYDTDFNAVRYPERPTPLNLEATLCV
jgi:hypothetical protein